MIAWGNKYVFERYCGVEKTQVIAALEFVTQIGLSMFWLIAENTFEIGFFLFKLILGFLFLL
jgi:hypothetical protein